MAGAGGRNKVLSNSPSNIHPKLLQKTSKCVPRQTPVCQAGVETGRTLPQTSCSCPLPIHLSRAPHRDAHLGSVPREATCACTQTPSPFCSLASPVFVTKRLKKTSPGAAACPGPAFGYPCSEIPAARFPGGHTPGMGASPHSWKIPAWEWDVAPLEGVRTKVCGDARTGALREARSRFGR